MIRSHTAQSYHTPPLGHHPYKFLRTDRPPQRKPEFAVEWPLPIVKSEINWMPGNGGSGKSSLALDLAAHGVLGLPYQGHTTNIRKALFLDAEDTVELWERRDKIVRHLSKTRPDAEAVVDAKLKIMQLSYDDKSEYPALIEDMANVLIEDAGNEFDLIIFDAYEFFTITSSNEPTDVKRVIDAYRKIAKRTEAAVLVTDHTSAANVSRASGSQKKWDASRSYHTIMRSEGSTDLRWKVQKVNTKREGYVMRLRRHETDTELWFEKVRETCPGEKDSPSTDTGATQPKSRAEREHEAIVAFVRERKSVTRPELIEHLMSEEGLGYSESMAVSAIKQGNIKPIVGSHIEVRVFEGNKKLYTLPETLTISLTS